MSTVTDEVLAVGREALAEMASVADGAHLRVLGDVLDRLERHIAAAEAVHAEAAAAAAPEAPAPTEPPPVDVSGLEARLAATDSAPPAGQ